MLDRPADDERTVTGPPADGSEADGSALDGFLAELEQLAGSQAASTPVPASDPTVADFPAVPGFLLHGVLGEGGMGVVYLATDERLKMRVALKVMQLKPRPGVRPEDHKRAEEAIRKRFADETAILARLDHPNVVRVFAAGEVGGWPYYTMRHHPRGSLDGHRAAYRGTAAAVAGLMAKVARAVQYLHDNGIWHRDLKPQNILLTDDGEPQVADFGIAKWVTGADGPDGAVGDDRTPTQTGARLGTYAYMAPEMVQLGTGGCGPAADVWAMGVMLYELLAGRRPFPGAGDDPALLFRIVKDAPPPLLAEPRLAPGTDDRLEAVALRALAKDPAHRYPSAAAFADDLDRWLSGSPDAPQAGVSPGLLAELRRNTAPPAAVLSDAPTVTAAPAPVKPRRRWRGVGWLAAGVLLAGVAVAVAAWPKDASNAEPEKVLPVAVAPAEPQETLLEEFNRLGKVVIVDESGKVCRPLATVPGSQGGPPAERDGFLLAAGSSFALYEISGVAPPLPYRLKAEVHHQWAGTATPIAGLYVRRSGVPVGTGPFLDHALYAVGLDTVNTPLVKPGFARHLGVRLDLNRPLDGYMPAILATREVARHPADRTEFREVIIDFFPERVTATVDGVPFKTEEWQLVDKGLNAGPARRVPPPGGGFGLIVLRGTAGFRNVILTRP